jgi:hypothetical protein
LEKALEVADADPEGVELTPKMVLVQGHQGMKRINDPL